MPLRITRKESEDLWRWYRVILALKPGAKVSKEVEAADIHAPGPEEAKAEATRHYGDRYTIGKVAPK